jgi:hypothetical protein
MSTIAYAALTANREAAARAGTRKPSVKTYVDVVAALIPAEVLALHAIAVGYCTEQQPGSEGALITPSGADTLTWVFFVLALLSGLAYTSAFRRNQTATSRLFLWRALVPPLAFVCWTALEPTSAFDAVFPNVAIAPRVIGASIGAVILGCLAREGAVKAGTAQMA